MLPRSRDQQVRIVILAKAPRPGHVKTRLESALGQKGASRLAYCLLEHTIATAVSSELGRVELCVTPAPDDPAWQPIRQWREQWREIEWSAQVQGDLGDRMAAVAERVIPRGDKLLMVGMDCPSLAAHHLHRAAGHLHQHEASLIPSLDGGYVLLGLRRYAPELFASLPWSTAEVCGLTRRQLAKLGWSWREQDPLRDIDTPADLEYLPTTLNRPLD